MKFVKISLVIIVVLVLVAGGLVFKTLRDAGVFKKINPHFGGQCEAVSGTPGPEDITIHPVTGMAFISSDDRRGLLQGGARAEGAIYGFDLRATDPQLVNLTKGFGEEFHPHGIGLYLGENGRASLFVVNHRGNGHFVEVFDYMERKLVHRASISGGLMNSPNDVIPVGPYRFYVTNDHGCTSELGRTLEDYLQLARIEGQWVIVNVLYTINYANQYILG